MRWKARQLAFFIGVCIILVLCPFLSFPRLVWVAERLDDVGLMLFDDDWIT